MGSNFRQGIAKINPSLATGAKDERERGMTKIEFNNGTSTIQNPKTRYDRVRLITISNSDYGYNEVVIVVDLIDELIQALKQAQEIVEKEKYISKWDV